MRDKIQVAFVGNPNCGKTTLFNAITGSKLKVANWPGVTVEKIKGTTTYENQELVLVDTPGIYALTCYTIEEMVTRNCVMDDDIDVIVNVVDASSLERNLYLTLQLLELGKPVVLALNMMDIVEERGMEIDLHRLPEMLMDIPVVPVSAAKKVGLDILLHAVVHHYEESPQGLVITYQEEIEEKIAKLSIMIQAHYKTDCATRWHAIKLLEWDKSIWENHSIEVTSIAEQNFEAAIIQQKYSYIETIVKEILFHKEKKEAGTDNIDSYLTHPIFGVPIFLGIMALVFLMTFSVGDLLKEFFEIGLVYFSNVVQIGLIQINTSPVLVSLIVEGIIAGVGGILTFIPNIAILFLALAVLEDSGYMSRVAYVMDGLMGKVGLSGKAFLPMVLGFGCTVPAIMATRALETEHDRKKTMILTPFMSCSAKLPIYVLFTDMFFPRHTGLVAFSMYVIGIIMAIIVAMVLNKIEQGTINDSLLIELPEYKRPNLRTLRRYVWNKLKDYLSKAGTTIFIASIIIWFILHFNIQGMVDHPSQSLGASIGKFLVPILAPAGLGMWQIGVALIAGISAKEVVVSSFTVLFGTTNIQSFNPEFGALNAYALMIFCLLYVPCVASIVTIRKESHSRKFTVGLLAFQLIFAWAMAVLVYQFGTFLFNFLI